MNKQSLTRLSFALFLLAATSEAEFGKLVNVYQALAAGQDDGPPDTGPFGDMVSEEIANATPVQIATLEPSVSKCLRSGSRAIRVKAAMLLYAVSARPDSAQLLSPYVEDLIELLDDPDGAMRSMVMLVLGKQYPRPSGRSLVALAAHLNDSRNTGAQFGIIAGALLNTSPLDPDVVHAVLAGLAKRPEDHLDAEVILAFGNLKITSEEALAFIRAGFANPALRPASIEAVGRMPKEVRDAFVPELQATLSDPTAETSTRSAAAAVLMQR